jgi:L-alanine-DL-glutamate epimerase-like enolase superfamily enzyme
MVGAARRGKGRIFFFLKEKEAKRTSSVGLGEATTGEAHHPAFSVAGAGIIGFADCRNTEPKWGSFFASFFEKKEVLAAFSALPCACW